MLEGLRVFQEGLVEHGLFQRSKETNQTVQERLEEELSDMGRFSVETHRIENPELRALTESLSKFAQSFYKLARKKGIDNYKQTAKEVNNFFIEMDAKFYGELQGKPEDMKKLAEHLNAYSIGAH
ncbi:MAG TPA: hypothetical protein VJK07_04320 [Candidatus Nanoarchaeia archaeon]|nr:hypothetical protein [Candidatus Nanoarchaeia archaeon]